METLFWLLSRVYYIFDGFKARNQTSLVAENLMNIYVTIYNEIT